MTKQFGQRVEVLATIVPNATYPPNPCHASAEVVENFLANTTVLVEGDASMPVVEGAVWNGPVGVTVFQTARLNVVAYPPNPCIGTLSFADGNGNPIGNTLNVDLSPGQAAFLDLPGRTAVSKLGQRAEIQPVVNVNGLGVAAACIPSTEVFTTLTGETAVYFPPNPCSPSDTSCVAF